VFVSLQQLWYHNGRPCGELCSRYCLARLPFSGILLDFKTCTAVQATGYQIDVDDWHAHVHHTLPYEKYLKQDDALRNLLQRIKLPLYVFTNGDRKHAEICLRLMGITDCFKVHSPASSDACNVCTCIEVCQPDCSADRSTSAHFLYDICSGRVSHDY